MITLSDEAFESTARVRASGPDWGLYVVLQAVRCPLERARAFDRGDRVFGRVDERGRVHAFSEALGRVVKLKAKHVLPFSARPARLRFVGGS